MFKRFLAVLIALSCLMAPGAMVSASEICGEALNSDIITYINNYAIPTYIVNGTSVVVAEELRDYGFEVVWDSEARALSIFKGSVTEISPKLFFKHRRPTGSKYCDLYTTDIKTYAEGRLLTAYNMNGFTMIPVEELTMLGEVLWYETERVLKMTVPGVASADAPTGAYFRVFAEDGRHLDILVSELEAYRNVGWYLAEDMVNKKAEALVFDYGYATAVATMEVDMAAITDTFYREAYEASIAGLYASWHTANGAPVAIVGSKLDFDTGYPRVNMTFKNIGGKKVTGFKVGFELMDSTQMEIENSLTVATAKRELEHGATTSTKWTIKNVPGAIGIVAPEIVQVTFGDGTSWDK